MFFIGFDNQLLSIQFELSRGFILPNTTLSLSSRTISYFIHNPSCRYILQDTTSDEQSVLSRTLKDLQLNNPHKTNITELLEFPVECYSNLIKRISNHSTKLIVVFSHNEKTALLWKSCTELEMMVVSLKSMKSNFSSIPGVVFVDDVVALRTAKNYHQKGILGGIESGAVLSMTGDLKIQSLQDDQVCFILSDSMLLGMGNIDDGVGVMDIDERRITNKRYVVDDLQLPNATTVFAKDSVGKALELMGLNEFSQLPVLDDKRRVIGMISKATIHPHNLTNPVSDHFTKFTRQDYFKVTPLTRLVDLKEGFERSEFLFVTVDKFPLAVVTRDDVERFRKRVMQS